MVSKELKMSQTQLLRILLIFLFVFIVSFAFNITNTHGHGHHGKKHHRTPHQPPHNPRYEELPPVPSVLLEEKEYIELLTRQKLQLEVFFNYLRTGRCQHLYFDMGTNVGVQLRKLYEPHYYPNASVLLNHYERWFHGRANQFRRVCSLGFEPSVTHFHRLMAQQQAYQAAGFPMVILTNTAVWHEDANLTFLVDRSDAGNNEWGSSLMQHSAIKEAKKVSVLAINISQLILHSLEIWDEYGYLQSNEQSPPISSKKKANRYYYDPAVSKIIAKIDIEGAEYYVMPRLIDTGALYFFQEVMIEWHNDFVRKFQGRKVRDKVNQFVYEQEGKFKIYAPPDESYHLDTFEEHPLPKPEK